MKKNYPGSVYLSLFSMLICFNIGALVGPVVPGQSLWCINKRIASEVDHIDIQLATCCAQLNSKLDTLSQTVSLNDRLILSDIDSCCALLSSKIDKIAINVSGIDQVITHVDAVASCCDQLNSQLDVVESKIDGLCHSTMITGPTTITQEGAYCLGNTINGAITIAASNVELDLSNRRVTQGITVNSTIDQVTIRNGVVEGVANAISVGSEASNITIEDVTVKYATRGINFQGVIDGLITNCEMVLNTTGLELNGCQDITIKDCSALSCAMTGYGVDSSTNSYFDSCSAVRTGDGNSTVTNNTVCGFLAANGSRNIFERCIANTTEALSTTDQNSIVAGFALRGSETCTKIINSEAIGSQTSNLGVTTPYGILLEATLDGLTTVTSLIETNMVVLAADWTPDGQYLATREGANSGASTTNNLVYTRLYSFNRNTRDLRKCAEIVLLETYPITLIDLSIATYKPLQWSPDGQYLAVGGTTPVNEAVLGSRAFMRMYKFDRISETLTEINFFVPDPLGEAGSVKAIDWSPNERYIAVGGTWDQSPSTKNSLFILGFNAITEQVTTVTSLSPQGGSSTNDAVNAVDWSPDGAYLAVGGGVFNGTAFSLLVYKFNQSTGVLTQVDAVDPSVSAFNTVYSVQWSYDGKYLAVGGDFRAGGGASFFPVQVYQFNRTTERLTRVATVGANNGVDIVKVVNWSPDYKYLAAGGETSPSTLRVYSFNKGSNQLLLAQTANPGGGATTGDKIFSMKWAPDGMNLAIGGFFSNNDKLDMLTALQFPQNNIITNNITYCNSGGTNPWGIGISGSSICNLILGNTAYSNPTNPPVVESNYQFVTNVFNQLFGDAPTELQNISQGNCDTILTPEFIAQIALQNQADIKQNQADIKDIQTKVDTIQLLVRSLITNLIH